MSVAVASTRARGLGILCAVHGNANILENLYASAYERAGSKDRLGVRVPAAWLADTKCVDLLRRIQPRCVILVGPFDVARDPRHYIANFRKLPPTDVFAEVVAVDEIENLRGVDGFKIDGWILVGLEAGGRIGDTSIAILLQQVVKRNYAAPLFVRGGFGLHGAAALVAAGATGVVFDDQILRLHESPYAGNEFSFIDRFTGQECIALGDCYRAAYRFLKRPEFPASTALADRFRTHEASERSEEDIAAAWTKDAQGHLIWDSDGQSVWPVGQAIGFASNLKRMYGTVSRVVRAFLSDTPRLCAEAAATNPLRDNGPLAQQHGSRFPLVQGPMTRVSDRAQFAAHVAQAGALPTIALALMSGSECQAVLQDTAAALDGRPWGIGLLGFLPPDKRKEQLDAVRCVRPAFCIIAGGRPDLLDEVERIGVTTYLHVPVPSLVRSFYQHGVRRFVFEGRECGGHIGPLGSLVLWELAGQVLLETVERGREHEISVLFAGGIHDELSAAIAAVMMTPLAACGVRTGALLGTAYIGTQEAVKCGAVVPDFQSEILACERTVALEVSPGHVLRCAATPFARDFLAERRRLLRTNPDQEAIARELEQFGVGRLRIATKGVVRNESNILTSVSKDDQRKLGMYMIGEAATLLEEAIPLQTLHERICLRVESHLRNAASSLKPSQPRQTYQPDNSDIAIVGMACIVPGSDNVEGFWHHLLEQRSFIKEVPTDRFDWRLYFDPNKNSLDKAYSKWGGFINDVALDPVEFGIPPNTLRSISPVQLLTLECIRRALLDADLYHHNPERDETEVIVANSEGGGFINDLLRTRVTLPLLFGELPSQLAEKLPAWTGDTFTGLINNIAAGRVANRFDFGGMNMTVDGACAASMCAIDVAVKDLETHRCNLAIAGGTDCANTPFSYMAFSRCQALSPSGQVRTFDKRADGIVISEGAAFVVLKRLADAEHDGDRIYAVIKGMAASSDGRDLGLTAPRSAGQLRAMQRAYRKAAISPSTVRFYEAHGTGTSLGDRTETDTLAILLRDAGTAPRHCTLGAHKAFIGHTKTAAGAVGLIKAVKALQHRTLPPQGGVKDPLDSLTSPESPLALRETPVAWFRDRNNSRRAGVSAFGFGGINVHAVVEEYTCGVNAALGSDDWPAELLFFRAAHQSDLRTHIEEAIKRCESGESLAEIAFRVYRKSESAPVVGPTLWAVAKSIDEARDILSRSFAGLNSDQALPSEVTFQKSEEPLNKAPLAVVYSGQGAQRIDMMREAVVYLDDYRDAIETGNAVSLENEAERLSDLLYPAQSFSSDDRVAQEKRIRQTRWTQLGIGCFALAATRLLRRAGCRPKMTAGHSFGELCAMAGAGWFDENELIAYADKRGRATACAPAGAMAAIRVSEEQARQLLSEWPDVSIANVNTPAQVVISGTTAAIETALRDCRRRNIPGVVLPVDKAFHSPQMSTAATEWRTVVDSMRLKATEVSVYSNETAELMPDDACVLRQRLSDHLIKPVRFDQMIRQMYEDGARVFVEPGPGRIVSEFISRTLVNKPFRIVSLDDGSGTLAGVLRALGQLAALGHVDTLAFLWRSRIQSRKNHARTSNEPTNWWVSGTHVWSGNDRQYGVQPLSTSETARAYVQSAGEDHTSEMLPSVGSESTVEAYAAYQRTMVTFLKTQEQVMLALLGRSHAVSTSANGDETRASRPAILNGHHPLLTSSPNVASADVSKESRATAPATTLSKQDIATILVQVVSRCTGYPASMLGLGRDLETHLGIDSIKRLEVVQELSAELLKGQNTSIPVAAESLSKVRTLQGMVDILCADANEGSSSAEAGRQVHSSVGRAAIAQITTSTTNDLPRSGDGGCPRFVIRSRVEPNDIGAAANAQLTGTFLVLPDEEGLARSVQECLEGLGARTILLPNDASMDAWQEIIRVSPLKSEISGIIHLTGATVRKDIPESLAQWRTQTDRSVKLLFRVVRAFHDQITRSSKESPLVVASVLRTGGYFGREAGGAQFDPTAAATVGFLKTLRKEIPSLVVRAVDLDPNTSLTEAAHIVCREFARRDRRLEVGYPARVRTVFDVVPKVLTESKEQSNLPPNAIILAPGGATGICAALLEQVARPGMTVVLIGRSQLEQEPNGLRHLETPAQLRVHFIANRPEGNVSPAQIEKYISAIVRLRERHQTMGRLRAKNIQVEYISANVANESQVRAALEAVYERHKRIDAVFHAAGIISDKVIADKSDESFDEVFDTKADSAFLLSKYLKSEHLKLLLFFGSAAGTFGNIGQSDYAAANEILNRLAWYLKRKWPHVCVKCINWGPWAETGMASREVNQKFLQRGIIPIPTADGCRFAEAEIRATDAADIEVVAGAGAWDSPEDGSDTATVAS